MKLYEPNDSPESLPPSNRHRMPTAILAGSPDSKHIASFICEALEAFDANVDASFHDCSGMDSALDRHCHRIPSAQAQRRNSPVHVAADHFVKQRH